MTDKRKAEAVAEVVKRLRGLGEEVNSIRVDLEGLHKGLDGCIPQIYDLKAKVNRLCACAEGENEPEDDPGPVDVAEAGMLEVSARTHSDVLWVYTDGSHIKGTNRRGGGGVVYRRDKAYRFALGEIYANERLGPKASNPTMELAAAAYALERIREVCGTPPVRLFADYTGVIKYLKGEWKPKPRDNDFQRQAKRLVDAAAYWPGLEVVHVRGHTGVLGNEVADAMAKRAEPLDELDGLKE